MSMLWKYFFTEQTRDINHALNINHDCILLNNIYLKEVWKDKPQIGENLQHIQSIHNFYLEYKKKFTSH